METMDRYPRKFRYVLIPVLIMAILLVVGLATTSQAQQTLYGQGNATSKNVFKGYLQANVGLQAPKTKTVLPYFDSLGLIVVDSSGTLWVHTLDSFVSIAGGGGSGTVTSVGSGFGLLGGPITTSGTLRVDTTKITTWHKLYSVTDSIYVFIIDDYVPYIGADTDVNIGEHELIAGAVQLDLTPTQPSAIGQLAWSTADITVEVPLTASVTMQIGQEMYIRGVNKTGVTITDGQVVYVNGAQGNRPRIYLAQSDSVSTSTVIGVATEDITNNQEGFVTVFGIVRGFNTSSFTAGDLLYLSPTTPGGLTNTLPSSPNNVTLVARALNSTVNGTIFVHPEMPMSTDTTMLIGDNMISPTVDAVRKYAAANYLDKTTARSANTFLAGPVSGASAAPTFRVIDTLDLPAAGVTFGTVGSATAIPVITYDATGRIRAVTTATVSAGGGSINYNQIISVPTTTLTITGSTTTVDSSGGVSQYVLLNGATTTININNLKNGATYTLIVQNDATPNRAITWQSGIIVPGHYNGIPLHSADANAYDIYKIEQHAGKIFVSFGLDAN